MNLYHVQIKHELYLWEQKMLKTPGLLERTAKKFGEKVNDLIPRKVHDTITAAVKAIIRSSLFGAEYTPKRKVVMEASLEERDEASRNLISSYKKVAAAEGAGTGAGGIVLSVVDFPALIAIKMKFLFELAHVYGYNTNDFSERIFILKIFQFSFTGPNKRDDLLREIKNWKIERLNWSKETEYYHDLDWEQFQKDYRDAIDFRKMLTLIPGIGAVAGAWANYSILEELGENGMNCYRLRQLHEL